MTAFQPTDFSLNLDNDLTLNVSIVDDQQQAIAVPIGTVGHFWVAPLAVLPDLQAGITPIIQRATPSANVRFSNTPPSPWWWINCDIMSADTLGQTPGYYYYEVRVDLGAVTKNTLKSGVFCLLPTSIVS